MIQAKNVMRTSTPVLQFDATVAQAVDYFKTNPTGFAIVQATSDRFHGVLTEGNLVRVFMRYQANPERENLILHRDLFEPAQLINENEFFPEIVKKLMTAVGHRVFVINAQLQVVGHITSKDILPYFSDSPSQPAGPAFGEKPLETLKSDLYLYESFFAKSPFMMHSVDSRGRLQMANEVLHKVLGYDYGEMLEKTIFDLYPKSMHAKAEAGVKTIFTKGFHNIVSSQMVHKSGKLIDVELVSRALHNQFDKVVGTMTVARPLDMKELLDCLPEL